MHHDENAQAIAIDNRTARGFAGQLYFVLGLCVYVSVCEFVNTLSYKLLAIMSPNL